MLVGAYVVQTLGVLRPEPFVASIPIALLVALILYVNEVPDRPGRRACRQADAARASAARSVINGYVVAAIAAFAVIALGVLSGLLPIPALAALLPLPLVGRVRDGLIRYYDQPYGLMAFLAVNIRVHLYVGVLLFGAYLCRAG